MSVVVESSESQVSHKVTELVSRRCRKVSVKVVNDGSDYHGNDEALTSRERRRSIGRCYDFTGEWVIHPTESYIGSLQVLEAHRKL